MKKGKPVNAYEVLGSLYPAYQQGMYNIGQGTVDLLRQGITGMPSQGQLERAGKNFKAPKPQETLPLTESEQQTNDIVNPGEAIANDMASIMTEDDVGPSGSFQMPTFSMPEPEPFNDPTRGEMANIISELKSSRPPLERAVPEPLSPLATFLASFGASMASSVTRNPAILENAQRRIADLEHRRQAIVEQNRLDDIAFNQNTHQQIMSLRLAALQNEYQQALATNDFKNQNKALEAITKFQEEVKVGLEKMRQGGETQRTKLTVGGRSGATAEEKGLVTMEKFQKQLGEIAATDPEKLPTDAVSGWFGETKHAFSKVSSTLNAALGAGLRGDSDEVKMFARGVAKDAFGKLYGIDWSKSPNPRQIQKIGQNLVDYGYDKGVAMQILQEWLGR